MNGIDTNILIYRVDRVDRAKRAKARDLLRQLAAAPTPTVMLWQVVLEFIRHVRSQRDAGKITAAAYQHYIRIARGLFPLELPTEPVLDRALDLADRYSLSHWDSMILGACKEAGIDVFYTEDMGAP